MSGKQLRRREKLSAWPDPSPSLGSHPQGPRAHGECRGVSGWERIEEQLSDLGPCHTSQE